MRVCLNPHNKIWFYQGSPQGLFRFLNSNSYLNMFLEQGLICMLMLLLLYLYYFNYVGGVIRIMPFCIDRVFMSKLVIIVNLFVLSGIHYPTMTQNGIVQFIIIIGAIAFVMAYRYKQRYFILNRSFKNTG